MKVPDIKFPALPKQKPRKEYNFVFKADGSRKWPRKSGTP